MDGRAVEVGEGLSEDHAEDYEGEEGEGVGGGHYEEGEASAGVEEGDAEEGVEGCEAGLKKVDVSEMGKEGDEEGCTHDYERADDFLWGLDVGGDDLGDEVGRHADYCDHGNEGEATD